MAVGDCGCVVRYHADEMPEFQLPRWVNCGALVACLSLFLLSGCASHRPLREKLPEGVSVAILTPAQTMRLQVDHDGDLKSFVPILNLVQEVRADSAKKRIRQEFAAAEFDIGRELQQALVAQLRSRGLVATTVAVERPLAKSALPQVPDARALLDSDIELYGLTAEVGGEFRPFLGVTVRLLEAKSKAVLYKRSFSYNFCCDGVRAPIEPADQWRDLEAVEQNLPQVRAAFVTGLSRISALIAADIAAR